DISKPGTVSPMVGTSPSPTRCESIGSVGWGIWQTQLSTISFVERPGGCSGYRMVRGHTIGREVARGLLGRNLDLRIRRDKLVRDGNALYDLHALGNERVVFHVAPRNEPLG